MLREHLRRRGIRDPRVLEAMQRVPREQFVPADATDQAYADRALPIDCEQTISQPYIVALMTELLDLRGMEKVLEVGTGSGYQTAMLCVLAAEVVSIERHADLSQQARRKLDALGCSNAKLHVGDGTLGCPGEAPFDRVIVTAAAERVPPSLFSQLAEEGIMVIPVGGRAQQVLQAIRKRNGQAHVEHAVPCRFVPLVGSEGWPEPPGPDEPGEQEA
jgi:protein-L-isoaspartate(D-aspartate) O-methyltransferase